MWSQINESKEMEEGLSEVSNLKLFKGTGEFIDEYEMKVTSLESGEEIGHFKGQRFVIATGARSFIPPIEGLEETGYVTNETFFGEKFPEDLYQ